MKATPILLLLQLCLYFVATAQSQTIQNPAFDFKNSGIYNIPKIELNDTATLLTVHCTFVPHWWVQFNNDEVIRDTDTKQEFKVKEIKGAVFGEYLWMPASGDSTVVLVFPPIPANTKKIDYQNHIFGLSLTPKLTGQSTSATVSSSIDSWIKDQLKKAPETALFNYELSSFFNENPARLIGCIKGYDTRAGFSTGIIYAQNELIRDDYPIVIKIEPDGRFEAEIPMIMPKHTWAIFNERVQIPFYIEPGQTLCMILDWKEFLAFDRHRNIRYQFKEIEFRGTLASINNELMAYPSRQFNYDEYDKKRKTMAPIDFKNDQLSSFQKNIADHGNYLKDHTLSPKAQTLLHNKILLENANALFNYTLSRDYYAQQDSTNEILKIPVPESYYDFLKALPLNDPSLLVCNEFSEFINRYEYCEVFNKAQSAYYNNINKKIPEPQKNILEFFKEEEIALTDQEHEFFSLSLKRELSNDEMAKLQKLKDLAQEINEKHKLQIQKYVDTYLITNRPTQTQMNIDLWKLKDSILLNTLGLQANLAYEIAKTRSLGFAFKNAGSKENAAELWGFLQQSIKTPYLVSTGNTLFEKMFPDTATIAAMPLPKGPATDIFMKIIGPHKGKVLFVDFWATTCGPCIASIRKMKETREGYSGNPDFEFIFITDQRSSPEKNYTDFVKEQALEHTYRISTDEFNLLRQLFRFNGIPRYVVIDSKGDVINDNFEMHNFEYELKNILPKYKTQ